MAPKYLKSALCGGQFRGQRIECAVLFADHTRSFENVSVSRRITGLKLKQIRYSKWYQNLSLDSCPTYSTSWILEPSWAYLSWLYSSSVSPERRAGMTCSWSNLKLQTHINAGNLILSIKCFDLFGDWTFKYREILNYCPFHWIG